MKTIPAFNFRFISKWRPVDLRTTMNIAHRCTSGVSFQGCNKSEIIEGIAKANGYKSNPEMFIAMMNEAARFLPQMKADFDKEVGRRLNEFTLQLKEP